MSKTNTSWRRGQSGNPDGRPRGTGRAAPLLALVQSNADALIQTVITRALEGDMTASRLLLDRYWPTPRAETFLTVGTYEGQGVQASQALLERVSSGDLGVEAALAVQQLVLNHVKVVESEELAARIEALEARSSR